MAEPEIEPATFCSQVPYATDLPMWARLNGVNGLSLGHTELTDG